jgi:hypothetical protein
LLYGGHDPCVCGRFVGGQVYWQLGYPEKGLALGRATLALAERIAHPFSLASARANLLSRPMSSTLCIERSRHALAGEKQCKIAVR